MSICERSAMFCGDRSGVMRRRRTGTIREIRIEGPLRSCVERIAVRCTLECCGVRACSPTPTLLGLWADSVGKEMTGVAAGYAREVARICDECEEAILCPVMGYEEVGAERAERRMQFRDFFQ